MNRFFHNPFVRNILAYICIVVVLLLGTMIFLNIYTKHGDDFIIPDFTGLTLEEASERAAAVGVILDVTDSVYVRGMARGCIYHQNPKAGAPVKSGRRILITTNAVSPKKISMPNVVGFSLRQARSELMARGLKLQHFSYVNDIATNNVLKQLYHGEEIAPGTILDTDSPITLVCGLSPRDAGTFVPDLTGLTYANAETMIYDNSLNVGRVVFDPDVLTYQDSLSARVYVQYPGAFTVIRSDDPSDTVVVRRPVSTVRGSHVSIKLGLPDD